MVITGPICLFNRGNIIASLHSVFDGTGGLHVTIALQKGVAGGMPPICMELERRCSLSVYLLLHSTQSEWREWKQRKRGGPPLSRAEQKAGDDMCQTGSGPRLHTARQRESRQLSGQENWQAGAPSQEEGVFTEL